MMNIKIGGEYITNVIGFELCRTHGLSKIKEKGDITTYEGFYNGNHFVLEKNTEYGFNDYELLQYSELYKDVIINDEFDQLIELVNDKEIIEAYKKIGVYKYSNLN